MNSINWLMRALSIRKIVVKVVNFLKKSKNSILHVCLGPTDKIHKKKIVSIGDDNDGNLTKICFCNFESYIGTKIMQNLSNKLMSEVSTKLSRIYMKFWRFFSDISLEEDQYTWTATNPVIG